MTLKQKFKGIYIDDSFNDIEIDSLIFDCDGVLVDAVSSWRTLHDHFGTDNEKNLQLFIDGELSDVEFMRSDIQLWKNKQKHAGFQTNQDNHHILCSRAAG